MLPEQYPEMHHLLLLCSISEFNLLAQFLSISNQVWHQHPTLDISLLLIKDNQYGVYRANLDPHMNCSNLLLTPMPTYSSLVDRLKQESFDAAIVLTVPHQSPFSLAYLCYLANIPIRIGQSQEFGGGVLSHWIQPPSHPISVKDYNLHLLKSAGFLSSANEPLAIL